jgi:hypothetical protein
VRRHPQLLVSTNQLPAKLGALSDLLGLPLGPDRGRGPAAGVPDAGCDGGGGGDSGGSGGARGEPGPPASARAAALAAPQLLCLSPRTLRARFAALQAASGLPAAAVAAAARAQPGLLAAAPAAPPPG